MGNKNNKVGQIMRAAKAIVTLLAASLLASSALADGVEVAMGKTFSRPDKHEENYAVAAAYVTDHRYPTEIAFGYIEGSGDGARIEDDGVFYLALGKRAQWKSLFLGLGLAVVSDTNQRLSTNLNVKSQLGWQGGPLVVKVEHLSNAGLGGDNDGDNLFFLAYRHAL